jgi:hypothetical protein
MNMNVTKIVVLGVPALALALGFSGVARAGNLVMNGDFAINGGGGQIDNTTTLADWSTTG